MVFKMKIVLRFICVYIFCLLILTGLLVFVTSIPQEYIAENTYKSANVFNKEGQYPRIIHSLWKLDNFTDELMLNQAYTPDSSNPFYEAILSPNTISSHSNLGRRSLDAIFSQDKEVITDRGNYSRYWHGYITTLKPLLILTDYSGIRIINSITVIFLFVFVCVLLSHKLISYYWRLFAFSIILFYMPVTPLSLQFSNCLILMFVVLIMLLSFPKISSSVESTSLFMFIVGICTAFFDFLTTPLITICYPLIIYFGLHPESRSIRNMVSLILIWFVGYGIMWSSKWILATVFTPNNIVLDAFAAASERINGTIEIISTNQSISLWISLIVYIVILIIGIIVIIKALRKKVDIMSENMYLIWIYFLPILWVSILQNHSLIHYWFVYRVFSISLFSILLYFKLTNKHLCVKLRY